MLLVLFIPSSICLLLMTWGPGNPDTGAVGIRSGMQLRRQQRAPTPHLLLARGWAVGRRQKGGKKTTKTTHFGVRWERKWRPCKTRIERRFPLTRNCFLSFPFLLNQTDMNVFLKAYAPFRDRNGEGAGLRWVGGVDQPQVRRTTFPSGNILASKKGELKHETNDSGLIFLS